MTTQNIQSSLFSSLHTDIVKRTNSVGIILALISFILGAFSFIGIFSLSDPSSSLSMFLIVLGVAFLLFSLFIFFSKRKKLVYLPTNSNIHSSSLYFHLNDLPILINLVEQHQFDAGVELSSQSTGNVRMDILFSNDHRFAAIQLFQFIPYTYTSVSPIIYLKDDDAFRFSTFLLQCKR